jgi:arsenate reductase
MIKIYGIKNCDTMKKAFTWLDKHKIAYTFHNYKTDGIEESTIEGWMKKLPLDQLINAKGTTWKNLTDKEKASIKNPKKAIALMIENTSMIKRPLVEAGKEYLLGFDADLWENKLGK